MAMLWDKWRWWQNNDSGVIDGGSDGVGCKLREKNREDGVGLATSSRTNGF
jgi:hypothetical protein